MGEQGTLHLSPGEAGPGALPSPHFRWEIWWSRSSSRRPAGLRDPLRWSMCLLLSSPQQRPDPGHCEAQQLLAFPTLFRKTNPGPSAHALPHPSHNLNNLETELRVGQVWGGKHPLQPPQSPLLVRLLLGRQLLVALACMLLGHGPLSPSGTPRGQGVGGGGRGCTGQGPAGLGPPAAGPASAPVDLCEQAGRGPRIPRSSPRAGGPPPR